MENLYHIGFNDSHKAKYAILPGDPGRVEAIAGYLDDPHFYCQNREYTTWAGKHESGSVQAMSTGRVSPPKGNGVEEEYKTGNRAFSRKG